MVNPVGEFTMLGHWRIAVRQAEEMARAGRLDEAIALASRPDVADRRQVVQLRARLAQDLIGRAGRRGEADDLDGAMDDLDLAERHGATPDALASARLSLADRVADEVRDLLAVGDPAQVVDRVEALARRKVGGPALRRAREAAEAWQAAIAESRRGEFGRAAEHLDRADRLAGDPVRPALLAARREVQGRQDESHPKVEALYEALGAGRWAEVLTLAEAILTLAPEHPAARQARARAWQQIAAISPSAALPPRTNRAARLAPADPTSATAYGPTPIEPAANGPARDPIGSRPAPATAPAWNPAPARSGRGGPNGRFLLWADAIGGYLVCLDDRVVLGRAGPEGLADIPLLGDVSRQHATLNREGDGYILKPRAPGTTFVNGRPADAGVLLRDGDVIRLGSTLELEFRQPSPVSLTARLQILSRHRLPLAVEGVILMAETCLLGPSAQAHIPAPGLAEPVVLYRQNQGLWCRAAGPFEVDGRPSAARAPLTLQSSVLGEGFSFSLEPLGSRSTPV